MAYSSWKQLADDIINGMFRGGDRNILRCLFDRHASVYGRAWGLKKQDAEEIGFHAIADFIRDELSKDIVVSRDAGGDPVGWQAIPSLTR